MYKKIGVALVLVAFFAAFYFFDLDRRLSLEYLVSSREALIGLYAERRLLVIVVYCLLYILVTALSLPGAAVMTLVGGAVFGFAVGVVAVSFASSIGAVLACLVSRFLLRDWVQSRYAKQLGIVNRGMEREGAFSLFAMRLIPVFPFFLINLVTGLTRMPLRTFYWVSQAGMLPGTLVFVNAGRELGTIDAPADILSPGLLLSFGLIGLLPVTLKKLITLYRRKKGVGGGG